MPTSLWDRLRQTRVVQVLGVYLGASWVVLQIADVIVDALSLPGWVMPAALLLLLVGLFTAVALAQESQWSDVELLTTEMTTGAPRFWTEEEDSAAFAYANVAEGRAMLMRGDTVAARALLEPWKTCAGPPGQLAR